MSCVGTTSVRPSVLRHLVSPTKPLRCRKRLTTLTSTNDFRENRGKGSIPTHGRTWNHLYTCGAKWLLSLKSALAKYVTECTIGNVWQSDAKTIQTSSGQELPSSQHASTLVPSNNTVDCLFTRHRAIGYKFIYISGECTASFFKKERRRRNVPPKLQIFLPDCTASHPDAVLHLPNWM